MRLACRGGVVCVCVNVCVCGWGGELGNHGAVLGSAGGENRL